MRKCGVLNSIWNQGPPPSCGDIGWLPKPLGFRGEMEAIDSRERARSANRIEVLTIQRAAQRHRLMPTGQSGGVGKRQG